MSPWRKRSNSSHLEEADGHDEDCTERGEGTNCETSGATSVTIRVGWSGVRVVLSSALDRGAWALGVNRGGTRRRCGVVGSVAAGCRSRLILFSMCAENSLTRRCQGSRSAWKRSLMRMGHWRRRPQTEYRHRRSCCRRWSAHQLECRQLALEGCKLEGPQLGCCQLEYCQLKHFQLEYSQLECPRLGCLRLGCCQYYQL